MTRRGKWIDDVSAGAPLTDVARAALGARLESVWRYLTLAAARPKSETENVHQLRVACRRSIAALETFRAFLPPRRALWFSRWLKQIRRAAGPARDLDVLVERMRSRGAERPSPVWEALLSEAIEHRDKAQKPIVKLRKKLERKRFMRRTRQLIKRVGPRTRLDKLLEPHYAGAARRAIRRLADDFFVLADLQIPSDEFLHVFRIEGKKLRYAMEIFGAAFDPAFRNELYPQIESLQTRLGHVNDHVSAQSRLKDWLARADENVAVDVLEQWIAEERESLISSRRDFLSWWTPARREDLKRQFALLTTPAAPPEITNGPMMAPQALVAAATPSP